MIGTKSLDENQNLNYEKIVDLTFNKDERTGTILFLIGAAIALIATDQTEEALSESAEQFGQASEKRRQALKTLTISSWVFFMANIIFTWVALLRLRRQSMEQKVKNSVLAASSLFGLTLTTIGNFLKLIGFGLTAIGNQIRAFSVQ